jgi:hydroxypyruvate isomerase
MLSFAANLETLWTELPEMDRPAAAARAGFEWVEFPFPYALNAADLRRELVRNGLRLALMACPPPNYTGGPRGFAALPGVEGRFRRDVARALRYAELLRPRVLQILPGEGAGDRDTLVENLRWAAGRAGSQRLVVEPGPDQAALGGFEEAMAVLDAVDAPTLSLLFDTVHAHALTGDPTGAWAAYGSRASHVQFAGAPGRGVPGTGGIDLAAFFAAVAATGHDGPLGAEYHPGGSTEATLAWFERPA